MNLRKIMLFKEINYQSCGKEVARPVTKVCAAGIISNPFSNRYVEDLSDLFDIGSTLGARLCEQAVATLDHPAVSYGKAALVGINGDIEHAHALLHPKLGKQMRAPIGGGAALIPSSAKLAGVGNSLDIPLGHKDNNWSFDHFDTMTIVLPDAPHPDEIVMVVAFADGGRLNPRCGEGPAV